MVLDLKLVLELAALGLCTGFLAGLLGIGGGMLLVPFLTHMLTNRGLSADLGVKMAIATAMATIVFTSVSSVRAHHKRGAVDWSLARRITPGIVGGAALASLGVFSVIKGTTLALFFAVFVSFSATQMLLDRKPSPSRSLPGAVGLTGVGGVIGFVSGLVGAGGGFISVPFMTLCNVAIHRAVATSAALGFPIALANAAGFMLSGLSQSGLPDGSVGYVHLPSLGVIACASVTMAPVGVRVAHALAVGHLKRVFALVLYALAGYMMWRGLSA